MQLRGGEHNSAYISTYYGAENPVTQVEDEADNPEIQGKDGTRSSQILLQGPIP
jgi:hypothetical protein